MSPSTALRPRSGQAASWRAFLSTDLVVIVVAGFVALLITTWLLDSPSKTSITIVNDTDYELTIDTAAPQDDSWLPVMVVGPHHEQTKAGVIDPGAVWVLRFAGQGEDGGQITVSRDELQASDWRFVVPGDVVERLDAAGATPPPR